MSVAQLETLIKWRMYRPAQRLELLLWFLTRTSRKRQARLGGRNPLAILETKQLAERIGSRKKLHLWTTIWANQKICPVAPSLRIWNRDDERTLFQIFKNRLLFEISLWRTDLTNSSLRILKYKNWPPTTTKGISYKPLTLKKSRLSFLNSLNTNLLLHFSANKCRKLLETGTQGTKLCGLHLTPKSWSNNAWRTNYRKKSWRRARLMLSSVETKTLSTNGERTKKPKLRPT